jgi:hypothetical protein
MLIEDNAARPASAAPVARNTRAELQAWYLDSLLPRLVDAAATGAVAPAAVDALDGQLRELLALPAEPAEEAA